MRATRASAAVERLKRRSGNDGYSMRRRADGLFQLVLHGEDDRQETIGEMLEQDAFVAFVNQQGPQTPRRVSKLDVAFEKQLIKKNPPSES